MTRSVGGSPGLVRRVGGGAEVKVDGRIFGFDTDTINLYPDDKRTVKGLVDLGTSLIQCIKWK